MDADAAELIVKLFHAGTAFWADLVAGCPERLLHDAGDRATSEAVRYAQIGAYLDARVSGQNHESALACANKALKATRKAVGYSYP